METDLRHHLGTKLIMHSDPTYEAWKQPIDLHFDDDGFNNSDPTYEAWKRDFFLCYLSNNFYSDPTYEAWKLLSNRSFAY